MEVVNFPWGFIVLKMALFTYRIAKIGKMVQIGSNTKQMIMNPCQK
jgi:hypothetical protein